MTWKAPPSSHGLGDLISGARPKVEKRKRRVENHVVMSGDRPQPCDCEFCETGKPPEVEPRLSIDEV